MSQITYNRGATSGEVTFDGPVVVLTEGADDALFVVAVAEGCGISDVQAHVMEGKDTDWRAAVRFVSRHPSFRLRARAMGLVRDADDDPAAAFDSCAGALQSAALPQPARDTGVVHDADKTLGIFIMPGDEQPGAMEDLVMGAADAARLECVDQYIECLKRKAVPTPTHQNKGRVQAYLAGLPSSPKTLAVATQQNLFDWSSDAFEPLRAWLIELAAVSEQDLTEA
jgi:hypothetical protein